MKCSLVLDDLQAGSIVCSLDKRLQAGLLLAIVLCGTNVTRGVTGGFTLVTDAAGLNLPHYRQAPTRQMQPYMTGGAAAGDFDGDGWVDLYLTRIDDSDLLYRNRGDGTFEDITSSVFGEGHLLDVASNGAAWGDVDNDGDLDLYVTSILSHRYSLFVNQGDGTMIDEAALRHASVEGPDVHYGFSPAFGDYNRDGFLDLYVTEWRLKSDNPAGSLQNSRLLRNRGAGQPGFFDDVTLAAGVSMTGVTPSQTLFDSQTFAARFSDLDADGWPDLAISGDHGTSRLFWNNHDGTFTDGTRAAHVGTDQFGMGNAIGDYDGDGDLDWFVTSIYEPGSALRDGNRLFRNDGDRQFVDVTSDAGVRNGGWGWGAAWFDFDNDGDLDLAQASGQDFDFVPVATRPYQDGPTFLWRNDGNGSFTDVSAMLGLQLEDPGGAGGKGLLTLDYDRDGDQDLLVVRNGAMPELWRNDITDSPRWLEVQLRGSRSNRQGIGAWVILDPDRTVAGDEQMIEISGGSHFLGQSPAVAFFGLGDRDQVDQVVVQWPSGLQQTVERVPGNQTLQLIEPVPEPAENLGALVVLGIILLRSVWQLGRRNPVTPRRE